MKEIGLITAETQNIIFSEPHQLSKLIWQKKKKYLCIKNKQTKKLVFTVRIFMTYQTIFFFFCQSNW